MVYFHSDVATSFMMLSFKLIIWGTNGFHLRHTTYAESSASDLRIAEKINSIENSYNDYAVILSMH